MTALDHARTRRWLAASLIFAGLLAIGLAWAGASPLFAGPDEPRHMATAYATYHGQVGHSDIIVPSMFASAAAEAPCFALNPSATADCLVIAAGPDVEVASQFSSYSPLYYMLVGWPTLFLHGEYALYGMRAANSLLFALVLTAAIMILHPRGRKSAALCGMLVSLTPMALFLSGVVNASALELSSACLVASLAVRAFQQQIIAHGTRPCLQPGGRRRGPDLQDLGHNLPLQHPVTDTGRLGGAVGPDAMVDDERRVGMPVPRGIRFGKQRKGAAIRPSRKGGEERLPACQPAEKAVFDSCREPIAGRCCGGSVSHRSWRPRSARQGAR